MLSKIINYSTTQVIGYVETTFSTLSFNNTVHNTVNIMFNKHFTKKDLNVGDIFQITLQNKEYSFLITSFRETQADFATVVISGLFYMFARNPQVTVSTNHQTQLQNHLNTYYASLNTTLTINSQTTQPHIENLTFFDVLTEYDKLNKVSISISPKTIDINPSNASVVDLTKLYYTIDKSETQLEYNAVTKSGSTRYIDKNGNITLSAPTNMFIKRYFDIDLKIPDLINFLLESFYKNLNVQVKLPVNKLIDLEMLLNATSVKLNEYVVNLPIKSIKWNGFYLLELGGFDLNLTDILKKGRG